MITRPVQLTKVSECIYNICVYTCTYQSVQCPCRSTFWCV